MKNSKQTGAKHGTAPKVFDVMRPGKALASATSRPIFAGPTVKDSSLLVDSDKPAVAPSSRHARLVGDLDDKRNLMDPAKKVTVQPMAAPASETPAAPAAKVPTSVEELLAADNAAEQVADTRPIHAPNPIVAKAEVEPEQPIPPESMLPAPTPETPQAIAKPDMPHTSEEVVASTAPPDVDMSRAVISTHMAPRKHLWREVLVVIGLLLFVVAVLNILLDTGILKVQGVPHTHLFNVN